MAKIGNEAKLILKLVEERVNRSVHDICRREVNLIDKKFTSGERAGIIYTLHLIKEIHQEIERS